MKISDVGLALIKSFESLQRTAYRDSVGIPTAGWGHTGPEVHVGQTYTLEQCEQWLRDDVAAAEHAVDSAVTVPITQSMYDALCSLVFNVGPGRARTDYDDGRDGIIVLKTGRPSALLRYLNSQQYRAARDQFAAWCMAGGRPLPGLVRRRRAEAELFERDSYPEA